MSAVDAYERGGWLKPGVSRAVNATNRPETVYSYRSRVNAGKLALAAQSAQAPELRERLQLAIMRGLGSASVPGLGRIAASDRYYEATHGGDWPEDH